MTAYIAARFSRKPEMLALAALFAQHNIQVRARWLKEDISPNAKLSDITPAYAQETAITDLEDIDACDTIIFFSEDPLVGYPRGGRHTEFGYAMGTGKRLVIIGNPENIFHFLPNVINYATVQDFLDAEAIPDETAVDAD